MFKVTQCVENDLFCSKLILSVFLRKRHPVYEVLDKHCIWSYCPVYTRREVLVFPCSIYLKSVVLLKRLRKVFVAKLVWSFTSRFRFVQFKFFQ